VTVTETGTVSHSNSHGDRARVPGTELAEGTVTETVAVSKGYRNGPHGPHGDGAADRSGEEKHTEGAWAGGGQPHAGAPEPRHSEGEREIPAGGGVRTLPNR